MQEAKSVGNLVKGRLGLRVDQISSWKFPHHAAPHSSYWIHFGLETTGVLKLDESFGKVRFFLLLKRIGEDEELFLAVVDRLLHVRDDLDMSTIYTPQHRSIGLLWSSWIPTMSIIKWHWYTDVIESILSPRLILSGIWPNRTWSQPHQEETVTIAPHMSPQRAETGQRRARSRG